MDPRNKRPESYQRSALVSGLEPWPCRNLMQVQTSLDCPQLQKRTQMAIGSSTAERCGSPTDASMTKAHLQTSFGSMLEQVTMRKDVSNSQPSSSRKACQDSALVRRSSTRLECGPPTLLNLSLTTASFLLETSLERRAVLCFT